MVLLTVGFKDLIYEIRHTFLGNQGAHPYLALTGCGYAPVMNYYTIMYAQ